MLGNASVSEGGSTLLCQCEIPPGTNKMTHAVESCFFPEALVSCFEGAAAQRQPMYSLFSKTVLQDKAWQLGDELGHVRNGQVFAAVNPHFLNTVVKRSHSCLVEDGADQLDHPNTVRMHAFVDSH